MGRKSASFTSLVGMFTARQKIKKEKGEPTELENQVAQAFVDLEINNEELRPFLKNLHIAGAKEVVVNKSTAAIVIFLPHRLKDLFRKTRKASTGQVRPMSRTLTAVHEAILGDLVYP